jgi:hypothetical protein
MSIYLEVVDAEQQFSCLGLGRRDQDWPGEDGRLRLIRELLPFVMAKYGISPQCLHSEPSPKSTSAGPSSSPDLRLVRALTVES